MKTRHSEIQVSEARIPHGKVELHGELKIPSGATGLVLFAHGSGSSRHSPRNQSVASALRHHGLGTLLFDLLTREQEQLEHDTRHLRFDIPMLAERLVTATKWVSEQEVARDLPLGYFGASTGAAAALVAAADLGDKISAVVSRGGRPDLADEALPNVKAPTLLIVGALDEAVIELNEEAREQMNCKKLLTIVPGASHLFEEPGTLEKVSQLAAEWFLKHLQPAHTH